MSSWLARLKDISVVSYSCFIIIFAFSILDWQNLISKLIKLNVDIEHVDEFYSSAYCRGSNHTNRFCKFKNLCYDSASDSFIFFHSFKSDIIGIPEDRFSPALVDFSSVYDHNTQYFNFIDLPSSSFPNFSVKYVTGVALLFKRFNPENLMHVFHDDLLPAYVTLKENLLNDGNNVYFVFADEREPGPYADLYENFLDKRPIYLNMISQQICFENSFVGLNKHSLWYQYGFKTPQGPVNENKEILFPTISQFRTYFCQKFSLNNHQSVQDTALLLTRGHNRKILNSKALAKTIESKTNMKTYIVNLEEYSVIDVIKKVLVSKLLVGIHGSLLILSLFLPPYSHIIELFPYGINPAICTPYKTLAEIPGLKLAYHSWENKIEQNTFPHPEYPADHGGILHLPLHMQERMKTSIVKPFLCCYNPEWLYRIYQDTIVDLESFSTVVNIAYQSSERRGKYEEDYKIRLFPSEVQNIACHLTSKNILNISWEKPWNVNFMNVTTVEYELWYQDNEESDIKAFIMQKTTFSFQNNSPNIYVWIRCHVDGKIGPFNIDPLVCQN